MWLGAESFRMTEHKILINRAPVLTLWATTVAERLGFDHDEALSLGRAVAGLNAQSKGRRLGIFQAARGEGEECKSWGSSCGCPGIGSATARTSTNDPLDGSFSNNRGRPWQT